MPGGNGSGFSTDEPGPDEEPDQDDEEGRNKASVRQYFDEVWNGGRLDLIDSLVASSYRRHHAGRLRRGLDTLRRYVEERRRAVPDLRIQIQDMMAEEDNVAAGIVIRGTPPAGVNGSSGGEEMVIAGIAIFRLDGGQIVESWHTFDPPRAVEQPATSMAGR
jgi:steroid delta-isomerase-like uncharacterized protein